MAVCSACGTELPQAARYCAACGARVDDAARAHEERKVVTVLFADLVGSTSQADRRDPEDVRATLRPFYEGLRHDIERHGGWVEKFIGDAVMALFGAPAAHEDDPERAIRAALEGRRTIARLNEERGLNLSVRISVATGEALIDLRALEEGHGMAAGDVTNTGFRIAAAAPVNGILVDETTYRATQQVIEFREADPVHAKGKALPQLVWEVIAPRSGYGDVDLGRPRLPFIGRREQLAALYEGLERAQETRRAQLINVIGVAGIGKSRLVLEFASELHASTELRYWRQGRSLPYGEETPFWALGEIVKAHAGILRTDDPKSAEGKLRRAVHTALAGEEDAAWVESRMRALVGLSGTADEHGRLETFAAWRRFFEALAAQRTVILVFEDIHWADEGLLEFIDHLAAWATGVPLLIICTARPAIFERAPGWGTAHAGSSLVTLIPLPDDETAAIVSALLGKRVPDAVEREVLAHAEGNPLYAGEYARMLVDRGFLRHEDGVWQIEPHMELPLPESVQAIIAARIDALPPEEKRLLQAAAVVGRVFWVGAVATLTRLPHYVIGERLDVLERKGFLRRDRASTVGGEAQYSFHHVLVRDIAYGQVPRATRADDHEHAAQWLEALRIDRADLAELVAHHYQRALELAQAAGRTTAELARRTCDALRQAGDRAAALHAWPTAKRLYEQALALRPDADEDDDERTLLAFQYGKAWFRAEGGGAEMLEDVVPRLLRAGDAERAADGLIALGDLRYREGDRDGAFERFSEAQALLARSSRSPTKAYVLSTISRFHAVELRVGEATRVGAEALAMAEQLGLDEIRAHALNNIGFVRSSVGDEGGLQDLQRSLRIALDRNSPECVRTYLNLGTAHSLFGDLESTFRVHEEGRQAAQRFGDAAGILWLETERLWELYWCGRWNEALALADEQLAELDAGGPRSLFEPAAHIARAWISVARNQLDVALDDAMRLCAFVEDTHSVQGAFPAFALRARTHAALGRAGEARADIDELLRLWRRAAVAGSYWTADLAFAAAEIDAGAELIGAMAGFHPTPWVEAARAIAAARFARAADVYATIGSRPDEALARLYAAATSAEGDGRDAGRRDLQRAVEFFQDVGAGRYLEQAERLEAVSSA
jgi:class 3 adenylate cyclase/tetratricopeptide (TPR) repeat protein